MVLFLHNRYRTTGGEERVVDELVQLVRERLGEPAELLTRDSAGVGPARGGGTVAWRASSARRGEGCALDRGAGGARPQPESAAWLARAGCGARRGGPRGGGLASVPSGVRDRGVLHRRRAVHPLSRAQHAAGGDPQLPGRSRGGIGVWRIACDMAGPSGRGGRRGDG